MWHGPEEESPFFPTSRIIGAGGQPRASPKPSTCSVSFSRPKHLLQHHRAPHAPPQTFLISCYSASSRPSFRQANPPLAAAITLPNSLPILLLSTQPNLLHLLRSTPQRPSTCFLIYCHFSLLNSTGCSTWASMFQCSLHCRVQLLNGVLIAVVHSSSASALFSAVQDFLSW